MSPTPMRWARGASDPGSKRPSWISVSSATSNDAEAGVPSGTNSRATCPRSMSPGRIGSTALPQRCAAKSLPGTSRTRVSWGSETSSSDAASANQWAGTSSGRSRLSPRSCPRHSGAKLARIARQRMAARGSRKRGMRRPSAAAPAPRKTDVASTTSGRARGVLRIARPASVVVHALKTCPSGEGASNGWAAAAASIPTPNSRSRWLRYRKRVTEAARSPNSGRVKERGSAQRVYA